MTGRSRARRLLVGTSAWSASTTTAARTLARSNASENGLSLETFGLDYGGVAAARRPHRDNVSPATKRDGEVTPPRSLPPGRVPFAKISPWRVIYADGTEQRRKDGSCCGAGNGL